jgi:hypothetical protein
MSEKRILVMQAELIRKIDDNRGDITRAGFIDFLIDIRLKQGAKVPDNKKYVTKEELHLFEEDIKQFLKSFLGFFVSYGLKSDNVTIKSTERLHGEYQSQPESPKQLVTESENQGTMDYELAAKLEILPPLDMHKITRTMIYLESLPDVETVELVPLAHKPSIIIILRQPIRLIERLKALPEVSQVEEVTEGKMIMIQMKLSENTVLDEGEEILDSKVSGNP